MTVSEPETIIKEFCDAWGDGNTERPDIDKIVSMFAEDGEWFISVPAGDRIKGRAAIRAEIERQLTFVSFMKCGTIRTVSAGATVVNERLDHFVVGGKRVEHALMAVYELDADHKILSWREYFDTADLARQMGGVPA